MNSALSFPSVLSHKELKWRACSVSLVTGRYVGKLADQKEIFSDKTEPRTIRVQSVSLWRDTDNKVPPRHVLRSYSCLFQRCRCNH